MHNTTNNNDYYYYVRFNETNHLIISTFYHKHFNSFMNYHRDLNSIFTFDYIRSLQWFGTGRLLTYYAINKNVLNKNFEINNFLVKSYWKDKKGSGYTVGSSEQR